MLYLASNHGIIVAEKNGGWQIVRRGLEDRAVTAVAVANGLVMAGTREGIVCSDDGGVTWRDASSGLSQPHVRWLASHTGMPGLFFAGTEPAGIYTTVNGGKSWNACPEVEELRDRFKWSLPYSPEAGCVRGFAFHGSRGYAAVEVGGVLVSNDRGASWELAGGSDGLPRHGRPPEPQVHADVHSIEVHPSSPDLVYAPTGGGFYRSLDGGKTWQYLYQCYCRAVWVDPADPEHLILGPADGVDRSGRIEETRNGGKSWQDASNGLETPWPRHMVERFVQAGNELLAVLSNGDLYGTRIAELHWHPLIAEVSGINAAAAGTRNNIHG